MWVPAGASFVMTIEPTCAPSSLGASTTNEREACVVPFSRSVSKRLVRSTRTVDSARSAEGRPCRKCKKRKGIATSSNTEALRRRKVSGLPRCGVFGPITSCDSEIVPVLARKARFLELESAKLVVSRIPDPVALYRQPSLSQRDLELHPEFAFCSLHRPATCFP